MWKEMRYDVFQELEEMQEKVSEIKSVGAGAKESVRASTGYRKEGGQRATDCHRCVCFSRQRGCCGNSI